jgi:peptidoglycan/LPS O-acetylase OafA/YrhL
MDYRREIDGLRACAVLSVILFHAGVSYFSGGFVGVDVFFVISGYLITARILSDLELGSFSLADFYERRARRILPALFLVMFTSMILAWLLLFPTDLKNFSESLIAVCLFVSNIFFWAGDDYFGISAELKPLIHTWSLSVEEQFYLLFPLVLLASWRFARSRRLMLLVAIFELSFLVAEWGSREAPIAAFYFSPSRAWELLLGSFAAFLSSEKNRFQVSRGMREAGGWLGRALIAFAVFSFDRTTPFPGYRALAPTLGAALLIVCASEQSIIGKLLGTKVLVAIGLISYSAYLWHQPLFAFARHASLDEPPVPVFVALSVLSLALAYVTWRYIEVPFRRRDGLPLRSFCILAIVSTATCLLFGIAGHYRDGFKERFPPEQQRFFAALEDSNERRTACHVLSGSPPSPDKFCTLGNGKVVGILLGDSHADALAQSLSSSLTSRNLAILSTTYNGCPPVLNVYRADRSTHHQCYEYNQRSFQFATHDPRIQFVILTARWPLYLEESAFDNQEGGVESTSTLTSDIVSADGIRLHNDLVQRRLLLENQITHSIEELLRAGKKVILVYPIPEVGYNVPNRLAKLYAHGLKPEVTTSYAVYLKRNQRVLQLLDSLGERANLIRIRPDVMLCNRSLAGRCVTELHGEILYFDDDHLSNSGAKQFTEQIAEQILAHQTRD